ncbi:MAG: YidC/Oxa1 family insertase periplasmic-domain containing protein [Planctomycetes bacterium]|nr:YidC/Oxa1 family insertase periplasmic-domain containing protein [Planctomycetota bacterium]
MDFKRFFQLILLTFVVVIVTQLVIGHFFGHSPKKRLGATSRAVGAGQPAIEQTTAIAAHTVTIGGAAMGEPFKLAMRISNVAAGVKAVYLNAAEYRQNLNSNRPLTLMKPRPGAPAAFSTRRVIVNGLTYRLGSLTWSFTRPIRPHATRAALILKLLSVHNKPLVLLKKIFQINPKTYDVRIVQEVRNLTNRPLNVRVDMLGPTNLPLQDRQNDFRTFQCAGYRAASHYLDVNGFPEVYQTKMLGADAAPVTLGSFRGANRLLWIASSNRFFTAIMRPLPFGKVKLDLLDNGKRLPQINYLASAAVARVGPDAGRADPRGDTAVRLRGATLHLAPHGTTAMPLDVYFGPKKRSLLAGSFSAKRGTPAYEYKLYDYLAVIQFNQGSWCSFLTFAWLALAILKILGWLHLVVHNYGIAIIVLVIAVRLMLHPLTRYGQVNMTRMQRKMAAIQPEIERVRTKFAKDKKRQQQEMMQLYKDHQINPAAGIMGCLPMLLQMPIWIALYSGLQVDIDLRHASFIPGWITDLSSPDTLASVHTPFFVPLLGYAYHGQNFLALNLLPVLLGVVFFFQMRFQMKLAPPPTDPQQRQTQKISQFMVILFPLFLYNAPSGLNLYICASTIGGLIDTWLVRRHLKRLEERQLLPVAASQPKKRGT